MGAGAAEVLYTSDTFRLHRFERDTRSVVVTFDYWEQSKKSFKDFYGGALWAKLGLTQLHLSTSRNDWFLKADTGRVIETLRRSCEAHTAVTTYGSSMGGFAALLFGGAISADRAIAISPQFAVDPQKVPFESRWTADRATADLAFDQLDEYGGFLKAATVVFDPRHALDAAHVRLMQQRFGHWDYVSLAFGGHPALQTIAASGQMSTAAASLLDGRAARAELVALHKGARRASAHYWEALADAPTKRHEIFDLAARQCVALPAPPPEVLYRMGRAAGERGDLFLGCLLMELAIARAEKPAKGWPLVLRETRLKLRAELRGPQYTDDEQTVAVGPSSD